MFLSLFFQTGLVYTHSRHGKLPKNNDDSLTNKSYYAGDGEYIDLIVLSLEHHQMPFALLAGGYILAFIMYLLETLVYRYTKEKKDKISEGIF